MAAAVGNQYAAKARVWSAAIQRALALRSKIEQRDALDSLAEKLLAKCDEGDMVALKELGDRIEGKIPQGIIGGDPDDPPIRQSLTLEFIGSNRAP